MFPKHLYRCPGPFRRKGLSYAVAGAADEGEEATLLAKGWRAELPGEETSDEDGPPTRAEMMERARQLGIRGAHLMKDATLQAKMK